MDFNIILNDMRQLCRRLCNFNSLKALLRHLKSIKQLMEKFMLSLFHSTPHNNSLYSFFSFFSLMIHVATHIYRTTILKQRKQPKKAIELFNNYLKKYDVGLGACVLNCVYGLKILHGMLDCYQNISILKVALKKCIKKAGRSNVATDK